MKLILILFLGFSSVKASDVIPLRGEGTYSWFFLEVYEAKLWAPEGEDLYKHPLKFQLKYKMDFKGSDIVNRSETEMLQAGVDKKIVKNWKPQMLKIFPNIKKGDRILAEYNPKKGIVFFHNEVKNIGAISDIGFSKNFLNIWLGEKTTDPKLRKKLLNF